jgi:hypothetical protein
MNDRNRRSSSPTMRVLTRYRNVDPARSFEALVERGLGELAGVVTIESADILLERLSGETPPVRVSLRIATPGPDLKAEARDYTALAAWTKVFRTVQRSAGIKAARIRTRGAQAPRPARPSRGRAALSGPRS